MAEVCGLRVLPIPSRNAPRDLSERHRESAIEFISGEGDIVTRCQRQSRSDYLTDIDSLFARVDSRMQLTSSADEWVNPPPDGAEY